MVFFAAFSALLQFISTLLSTLLDFVVKRCAPLIDYVATHHRPAAMMLVVLPLSFLLRNVLLVRDYLYTTFIADASTKGHQTRVARVVADVKARADDRANAEGRKLCTARAAWQNLSTRFADYKKNSDCIFVGDFRNMLYISEDGTTVTLEPLVDVGMATKWLLPKGYMLATTLEIEEATIGGLACAVGMTTASHKYGLLQETVEEYQIVLGDGSMVRARRDNDYSDLWHAFPWSHGSLGLLVGLTLKIIPVTKYVRVNYMPVVGDGPGEYSNLIRQVSLKKEEEVADFVEATVFSRNECVVMEASFCPDDEVDSSKINQVGWWYKKWFYTHVRDIQHRQVPVVEYIPTYQYIFRHNRGIFWTLRDQLPEKYGNNVVFRYVLGWLNPPQVTFLKMPATPQIKKEMMVQRVYQDIVLPLHTLETAIELAGDLFEIWPILVYPSRIYDHGKDMQGQFRRPRSEDLIKGTNYAMYYDLGVYGIPAQIQHGEDFKPVTSMRTIEKFTKKNLGAPFLYANTFMSRNEFQEMFDLSLYERMRVKYKANDHFHHLYNKTSGCQSYNWEEMLNNEQRQPDDGGLEGEGERKKRR